MDFRFSVAGNLFRVWYHFQWFLKLWYLSCSDSSFQAQYKFQSKIFKRNNSALQAYFIQDDDKTEAVVDGNEITCPKMYTLSKDNKLCYFLAKTRQVGSEYIEPLLVNKTMAVSFCNFFSNGTIPYGKSLLNIFWRHLKSFQYLFQKKVSWKY